MSTEEAKEDAKAGATLQVVGWAIIVGLLSVVIEHSGEIEAFLLSVSPDVLDPIVSKVWSVALSVIMLFVGPNRSKSSVKSVYTK